MVAIGSSHMQRGSTSCILVLQQLRGPAVSILHLANCEEEEEPTKAKYEEHDEYNDRDDELVSNEHE